MTDTRIYATVLHSDHSLQYSLTVAVNILATPLNFLSFYLILFKSKRERTSFKVCLFLAQLSFYIAQFHLGVLTGLVTLHPFPAVYSVGLLKNYFTSFTLCFIWCIFFCFYVYISFVQLFIRMKIVARPGKIFNRSNFTYNSINFLLALYIFVPFPGCIIIANSSLENMKQFVLKNYPNNMEIFDNPGVFVLTDTAHTDWIRAIMIFMIVSATVLVTSLYFLTNREIQLSLTDKSVTNMEEILQSLNNYAIQSLAHVIFLGTSCSLIMKSFFNDPSVDSRISNTIAYTSLCGASIPYQILMIYRNPSYREFVSKYFKFAVKKPPRLYQQRVSVFS